MSPGGSTPSSSRSCPELPPLSNMVTTALGVIQGLRLRPPSRLGRPVPPPKQPTRMSRRRTARNCITLSNMATDRASAVRPVVDDLQRIFGRRLEAVVEYGWHAHGQV